mgnify:CR=1 FL=1
MRLLYIGRTRGKGEMGWHRLNPQKLNVMYEMFELMYCVEIPGY